MLVTNKIKSSEAVKYIATQMTAGIFAALVYNLIAEKKFIPAIAPDSNFISAFFVELIFTFLLCFVILNVAATDKTKGNDYFGIAIGFTLMIAAFAGGSISGGAFNPAVGISPLLYDISNITSHVTHIVLYLAGPVSGGLLAGIMYKSIHSK
jgi:aquaporin Z